MSIVLHGIPVGGGIAIGRARLVVRGMDEVAHNELSEEELPEEVERYEQAIRVTRRQLDQLRSAIPENAPAELGAFISLHLMLLSDVMLSREPIDLILEQGVNAEWALKQQADRLSEQFDTIEDEYLRERKQDMLQVVERIYNNLLGLSAPLVESADFEEDVILIAHDLSPADTVYFKESRVAAFITDAGGPTSHTAILGRGLDIPSVIALRHARKLISEDECVIVDGNQGIIIVEPNESTLMEYRQQLREYRSLKRQLNKLKGTAATTQDGINIELMCNIESIDDIKTLHKLGADGVGLFRSEFAYLNRDTLPTEDELYHSYTELVKKLKGKPLTIRTVDLGVDKNPKWFGHHTRILNPALGLTGIRLCLSEPIMFRTQMRAILRASAHGVIKMMWPMISSVEEVIQCRNHLEAVQQQLREESIVFDENMLIGIMVETPAAALTVNTLLKHVDFISIGTNDLIQYTLAADRADDSVSYMYQPHHPAVLKLLQHVIRSANRMNKSVSVCGEMAGDVHYIRLLLGLGLRNFSMNPNRLLSVKNLIIQSNTLLLETPVQKMIRSEDPSKSLFFLKKINKTSDC